MYVVAIFALALLSPLPFVSPFVYDVQNVEAQTPFGTSDQNNDISSPVETSPQDFNTFDLTSSTDNTNQSYAKAGDTITVTFTTDDILHYNATATINDKDASVSIFNNVLTASIPVLETDPDGYINFEINVSSDSAKISVSDADITGNVVFVDKHVPVIKINGSPLVYVEQNGAYIDLGASVFDADPAYPDDANSLSDNSSSIPLDTIGTYTIVYTAVKDGAGNEPFIKTRIVSVESSTITAEASYVDSETILLRFNTAAPAFYSGPIDLTSAVTVDGESVNSAIVPAQIRSVTTLDNSIPALDFLTYGSRFGMSVAHMGDLNQDGYEDIMVGIPQLNSLSDKAGAVAILHLGENAQSILDVFVHDGDTPNMPPLPTRAATHPAIFDPGDKFAEAVANVGDINGDGFTDIVVGAKSRTFDSVPYGVAYTIFLGPNGSSVLGYAEINHTLQPGPQYPQSAAFGHGVINMGDLNNDGINDIAVTAAEAADYSQTPPVIYGAIYIMHLGSDGLPIKSYTLNISEIETTFSSLIPASDSRTWSITNMGDLNNDGFTDIVTSSIYSVTNSIIGNNFLYIYHLGENGTSLLDINQIPLHGTNMPPAPTTFVPVLTNYGSAIQKLEDLNGDGYADLIVAAPDYPDEADRDTGLFYVIFLGQGGTSALGYYEISVATIGDLDLVSEGFEYQHRSGIGSSFTVLGDINSDGGLEIIAGVSKFVSIVHDGAFNGQGGLHVLSLAGPDDKVPHVVVKPNAVSNTVPTSSITLDASSAKLNLGTLYSDSSLDVTTLPTSDNIAPAIHNITMLTNTSLNIEFSENIETDTEFGVASFRLSETAQHISVTNALKTSSNTVLLNVTRISSSDEPLVEIFDSAIKDTSGNVLEYTSEIAESNLGSYPLSIFWGYNDSLDDGTTYYPGPVAFILFEDFVARSDSDYYSIDIPGDKTYLADRYYSSGVYAQYHAVGYFQIDPVLPFDLDTKNLEMTLSPNDVFLDSQNNTFSQNYTLPIDTLESPKILYAETSEGRYIILTLDRYVTGVETSDFTVSDSLSVQNVNVSENKLILDVGSMPTDSTPTVTISGTIKEVADSGWKDFVPQSIVGGTTITAIDGSRPTILTAEYDNLYTLTVTYSEPIDVSTLDETDYKTFYNIESTVQDSNIKRITNIDTATDGLSSVLTFDKKLNPDSRLALIGSVHDKIGTAMISNSVLLSDTTPPTMSSVKTITTTSIEIQFNDDIDASTVYAGAFDISGGITVTDVTVLADLDDVVFLQTSTIPENAKPTVTIRGTSNVADRVGNPVEEHTVTATDAIVPSLSSLSILSNNADTGLAKSGDRITLTLVANENVDYVSGTIFEKTPQISETSVGFSASVVIDDTTSNTNPTFAITIVDDNGNTKTVTQSDITGTTVIVDTLAPVITLIGSENTTLVLDRTYIDEGTVVIDNDPNYAGTSTLDATNIDNAELGNYTVTYSAPSDSAGNVPATKTRNVEVVKLDPIPITSLTITSSSGDNFANASKIITLQLEATSSDLGNFTGTMLGRLTTNTTNGGSATFQTTVLPGDTNGNVTFSITVTNSSGNEIQITNDDIIGGSFVTVDTIKPVITLNGNSPDTVFQGDAYSDQGATVSDINYLSSPTVTALPDNLDTSSLEPQNITYSAPPDAAGNIPDSINRTVTVLAKPLGIDTLTIESSNTNNPSYAKIDDLITITLDANGTINSATTIVASNTTTPTLTDDELVAAYTVDSTFSQGSLGFSIVVSNEDNKLTSTFTQADLPGSSIIIDTIAPSISLIGNNNTVVPTNSSYTDPGATATDASYTSDLTVTGANTDFDITNAGNYTYTYTAEDEAGNTDTITRNVIVKDTPPIGINALEIESNNTNTLYAKIGDAIYFTLDVNNTINFSNVVSNVPGTNVFNTEKGSSNNELYVDAIVLDTTVIESNATFTIEIANANGTTLTVTKDDLTTSNVFIDTIPPRIAPIGSSVNYSIVNGTENPTILNVTVDDGDLNYSGNYTLITNGTVNANLNGSIYNYTYTADADSAGNPGDSLTRIITIIDADPIAIESLSIASSPGNSNFANLGKTITVTLVTKDSTNLGNFTGTLLGRDIVKNDVSSGTVTFTETVSLGDADGNVTFSIVMTNSSGNRIHITNININDSSFVTIDTTKPVITLTDPSSNTVFKGDTYLDPSATVSDLNYLSSPTVTALPQSLDTSSVGPQTITYSGSADAAGNVPDDVIRTVTVLAKPLGIDTLTIESSNTNNPSYAKIDDLITITLDANGTINSATTIVASNTTTPTLTDDELVAAYTVDSTFSQGSLGFSIVVSNEDNKLTSTFTQTDLPGSSIIIDTIAPSISLIDNNNTIVPTNSSYTDPGATATDASYTSDLTVTGANSDFDITNAGNYTFTYTAEDEAGNTATITRNVIVKDIPPIGINALEIESDNTNDLYAKVGDDIYFTLNVNNTINFSNVVADVPGTNVFNIETGSSNNEVYVDATVLDTTIIESNATFTITIANTNGTTLTVTQDDLTTPNVFIDTIPPRITPIGGSADYSIVNGTEDPTILNVTVTDGDLNYSGNYTLITNGTIDNTINGSIYNYTYTADADTAGNPGDSLTRIITIIDAPLINITSLSITSNSGNNFANEGKTITLGLETDSNNLGNFTGTILGKTFTPTTSGGTATFTVPVSSSDTNGNVTFSIVVTNSTGGRVSFTEADITDDSFVTIDTIAPNITLNGENNTIVALDAEYTDPGAAITDQGNPSYVGTITTTPATLDTSSTGDKIITYTGSADAAGNVPDSIIRIVSVKDAPPIDITRLTLEGNVGNTSYAKGGDTVDFSLEINYTIASYTITIFNKTTSVASFSSSTITLTETVPTSLTVEEYATFSITIVDGDGLPNTLTQEDLTSGNVFIDTIPPSLTLIRGPANYSIVNGTESPMIRNVTAHDGDPYYSGNYTLITPNGIVNADINGSVYSYTYTAVADGAGNLGASLTRIITIVDALQIGVTSLSITSNSGNNFANADKIITLRLQTDSDDLHDITGTLLGREFTSTINGGGATFTTTVLSGDTNGNVTFSIEALNSSDGRVVISESDITDGSFVTIDTVLPVITLNGENNTIVAVGVDYTDPSATVADQGNPSYAGTITARPATLDTSSAGNKTITYTAPADAAGNVPVPKIRIVSVEDAPPIDITLFTITSDNSNNSYAKAGDTLSIQSSINYTIASYTATIFGIEQSESNQNSNGFIISQQVPSNLTIEEYATFSITIIDEKGLPNIITENTQITSSQLPPNNVFIDTVSPTVKLSTPQISISVNDVLPNITATITEKDPNYGEKTIAIPGSNISASDDVDIGTVGAYPYTYTAPDDNAGNPGQSATISIVVKNATLIENRTTILSSTVIKDAPQSFSDDIIIAEIHNDDGDSNNTLSLDAPIVELDVSDITNTAPGANNYITTYTHPIDLTVHNTISAQIELGTVLEFNTADTTIRHNFTIHYVENDDPNDDVIRLGHTDIDYELDTHAIGITFERVREPFNVSITNPSGVYVPVKSFEFTTTTENSANAWDILDGDSTYSGTLYTYDKATRTVTVWTSHLSDVRLNSTSSGGGDESDSNSPTLGKASSGAQLVTNGFEYNGLTVNVGRYHTEFPLIGTNVGDINTIKMKVYDSAGPTGVKRVEFALGVPDIGLYHEAEAFVEVWMQRDSVAVQETIIVDELNLLEDSDVSATVSQTSCSDGAQQCLLVELQYSYREPPAYNTISIKPVDWDNNAHQFYFNDGIHVDGDSINLPKEITISASHAADTTHAGETLHLVQIDRAEHLWVDQYGYQWMIIGNTVRQITVPEYLVPNDNTYGTLHGPDRNHPEFASSVYAEQQRAQETLAEILGHATIMKPLPESGGTIYFDATGTDSRSGDSFKLLLELETARMHQLSNLLYDGTS